MEKVTLSVNEQSLIDNSKFKRGSRLTKINNLEVKYQSCNSKTFNSSIVLSREIKEGSDWFKTVEAKDLMKSKEVKWNKQEFGEKMYGYKRTQYYEYISAGKVTDEEIAAYKEDAGDKNLSITALLKFLKPDTEKKDKKDNFSVNYSRDEEGNVTITKVDTDDIDDVIAALLEQKLQAE